MIPLDTTVWLYGSFARGDADEKSDIDVLIIDSNRKNPIDLTAELEPYGTRQPSLSRYTWSEIEGMRGNGSLFLHHLKAEGRPLEEGSSVCGRLRSYLEALTPYTRARQDVRAFRAGLDEARDSLQSGGSIVFELSVIATLIRHSSILGCYVVDEPTFGRISPVERIVRKWGMDQRLVEEFRALYSYKMLAERRVKNIEMQDTAYGLEWCCRLEKMLSRLEVAVEQYTRNLHTTASSS